MEENNQKFAHVLSVSIHKKSDVVKELKQSIKAIYTNIIKNINEEVINQLEIYIKEYTSNIIELDLSKIKYSLHFIELLNFNMSEDEIYGFDDMFILDYIFSYQIDADVAKKNLSNNLEK